MKKIMYFGIISWLLISLLACGGKGTGDSETTETTTSEVENQTNVPEIDNITRQLMKDPKNPTLLFNRAQAFYNHQGYDQALRDLRLALTIDSTQVDFYHLLADVNLDYFRSKQALDVMELAAKRFPNRIPTLLKLGEFQMIVKANNKSASTINKILKQDPQNAEAYFLLGMNFKETGDTVRSINSFKKATEIDPDLVDAWVILGNLFESRKNPIAEDFYTTAITVAEDDPKIRAARADYYYQLGKLESAKKDYMDITRKDLQNSPAFFNLGLIYLEQDSLAKANQFLDFAVKANPVFIAAYYYRAVVAEVSGDKQSAIRDFKQVLSFDPDFKDTAERLKKLQLAG